MKQQEDTETHSMSFFLKRKFYFIFSKLLFLLIKGYRFIAQKIENTGTYNGTKSPLILLSRQDLGVFSSSHCVCARTSKNCMWEFGRKKRSNGFQMWSGVCFQPTRNEQCLFPGRALSPAWWSLFAGCLCAHRWNHPLQRCTTSHPRFLTFKVSYMSSHILKLQVATAYKEKKPPTACLWIRSRTCYGRVLMGPNWC